MLTSTRRGIVYPNTTRVDTADVPRDIAATVAALELDVVYGQGTFAARPVSTVGSPGMAGRMYVATDLTPHGVYWDYGTGWDQINSTATSSVQALNAAAVLDTGMTGHKRAGRVLALTDFTTLLGLTAPQALWNLSDLTDASGNARALTNKGAVTFAKGITGAAAEAAQFVGNVGQALYINDAGAGDPFRIPYGSWGCWFKTSKRGGAQALISKENAAATAMSWVIGISGNYVFAQISLNGTSWNATFPYSTTDVCDDRWHHAVCTYDGVTQSLYIDGQLESSIEIGGAIVGSAAPLNIGGYGADAANNAVQPVFGRVDEAFVTQDVLNEDQIRLLYAVKIAHGATYTPTQIAMMVRRLRKGGPLTVGTFSTQPLHLWNFTGVLTDAGSLNNALALTGAPIAGPGADGAQNSGYILKAAANQYLSCADTGLPIGNATKTMGIWFKTVASGTMTIFSYGTQSYGIWMGTGQVAIGDWTFGGVSSTAQFIDGLWHFAVFVYDNAAADGQKRKLYIDSKLVAADANAGTAITLVGANGLQVGHGTPGYFDGQLDGAFITNYAMIPEEIAALYALGSLTPGASSKNEGDHVERVDATNVYLVCDGLESQHQVDLQVAA